MAQITSVIVRRLYALLLRLYPPAFQREFGAEMLEVFSAASQQEKRRGLRFSFAFFLKELIDLPASLLHQYGWTLFSKEQRMSGVPDLQSNAGGMSASLGFSNPQPSSWKELLLAGLPFLAVAYTGLTTLLYGLGAVPRESKFLSIFSVVLGVGMLLFALGTFVYAWRKHFPRWSAAWYGFWIFALLVPLGFFTNSWDPPPFFYALIQPLIWMLFLLGIAWFLYKISCRDAVKAILAALPIMGLTWFVHQEFVRDDLEGAIALVSWLLIALAAIAIVRLNTLKAGVLLALGVNFLIGLAYAYEGIYFGGTLNFDAPGPNAIQVLRSFLPHWVTISTLVIGPLLARRYRELGYRLQPAGLWLYRLVLFGLLLLFIANLAGVLIYTDGALSYSLRNEDIVLNILAWVGLGIFVVSSALLIKKAAQAKTIEKQSGLGLLSFFSWLLPFALLSGLPHRLLYPSYSTIRDFGSFLDGRSPISQFPEFWLVLLGFLWALAASWWIIVAQASRQPDLKS